MGRLTMKRTYGSPARLNGIGVFVFGGGHTNNTKTSEFLPAGTMQWKAGPEPPVDVGMQPCIVPITATSFLVIHGKTILEFDAAIDGPVSSQGWRSSTQWPKLRKSRQAHGCARIGDRVVITGGHGGLRSTEVLNLVQMQITEEGEMATSRGFFRLITLDKKIFAVGGYDGSNAVNSVEEWVDKTSTWKPATDLAEKRFNFGATAAPKELLCPT